MVGMALLFLSDCERVQRDASLRSESDKLLLSCCNNNNVEKTRHTNSTLRVNSFTIGNWLLVGN